MNDRRLIARLFDNEKPLVSTRYQTVNGIDLEPGGLIPDELAHTMRMRLWLSRLAVYEADWHPTPIAEAIEDEETPPGDDDWMILAYGVEVVPGDSENYFIKTAGIDEIETVNGLDAAKERAAELRGPAIAEASAGQLIGEDGQPVDVPAGDPNDPPVEIAQGEGAGEDAGEGEGEDKAPADPAAQSEGKDAAPAGDEAPAAVRAALVTVEETGGGWYAVAAPWLDEPIKVRGLEAANTKAADLAAAPAA